ncbi:MAG TPA: GSCFA domain-containing protein [Pararhizobium sp.]|uniref:GSCFA domain-containing protein n=1 Tax=Pararhizobium sp. TaxID=1977563 RepID=UPI002CBE4859|nr:GSCFA domain-containing protein [Pararhizobium sp.]HTO30617.1 GSCFA domain-containing protein [Pararhizobium sp.]
MLNDDDNAEPIGNDPAPKDARIQKIQARDVPNPRWSTHHNNKLLTVVKKPIFGQSDKIFTIGSCFAERIRVALTAEGLDVGPPMQNVPMAHDRYRIDRLPARPHSDYFNTFTIRQEFERHVGEWSRDPEDYWLAKDQYWETGQPVYQDPYRRLILARSPQDLLEANEHVDRAIDQGIREASVFFLTMGMAEVFRNKRTGKIACQKPGYSGGSGADETDFYMSTYEENLENMSRVVDIINMVRPGARIVVTVSPVGLGRTFGDDDIIVANTESKSILRVALGALARKYDNVTYFPSYEIVMANAPLSFREDDGRHVANWVVSRIVSAFKAAHFIQEGSP